MGTLTGASNPLAVAGDAYVWIYAGLACCAIGGARNTWWGGTWGDSGSGHGGGWDGGGGGGDGGGSGGG